MCMYINSCQGFVLCCLNLTCKGCEGVTSTMNGKGETKEDDGPQKDGYQLSEIGGGVVVDSSNGYWITFSSCSRNKARIYNTSSILDLNGLKSFYGESTNDGSSGVKSQDADYSHIPSLSYDLEDSVIARFPLSEYWKLCLVNKRFLALLISGELFKIRREIQFDEPSVFMFASGESSWLAFDREFKSCRRLPVLPADICFSSGDKESFCAGTHLLISGREIEGLVIWRYELSLNKWYKGPSMVNPRCLFASATCGIFAFVAGGIGIVANTEVYDTAEKYNPDTQSWEPLPKMIKRRKLCSGCYMDNRFYVIGGRNKEGELTCGEYFDVSKNKWELIPEMFKDDPVLTCHSPPLVAVVKNELYSLEASSNQLKVYLKKTNTWKQLGPVPIRADFNRGWGVAFKSLGNELLVIGASAVSCMSNSMSIYTCCPDPNAKELQWNPLDSGRNQLSHFILNCSVMVA